MDIVKYKYLKEKLDLLREFCIHITPEIKERLETLYPNEIAIENYLRVLIIKRLEN